MHTVATALPYRGMFGAARPPELDPLPLPPRPMPSRQGLRPLKAWRYVGVYGAQLMICVAAARVGPAHQCFWAIWDRRAGSLHERTRLGRGRVRLGLGLAQIDEGDVQLTLQLFETAGVETVCRSGESYAWTRKQGGIAARGSLSVNGIRRCFVGLAVIDDTAAYYARHTSWSWSAGVGRSQDGRELAWNLVAGVNDPPRRSERTIWVDGEPHEAAPVTFAPDLGSVGGLRFDAEAVRESSENLGLIRSR